MAAVTVARRPFLACLGGMVLAGRSSAEEARTAGLSAIERTMQAFVVERMVDQDGLCRSCLCAATLAPWTNADLDASGQTKVIDMFKNSPDKAGCLTYENALMATGEYAVSQIVRHRVTGEEAALEQAARAVRAILAVIDEGRHHMPGWLPKPFGGLARARDSHEMSSDQYTKAVIALHAWRPLASDCERRAIDQFFVDAADFFRAREWKFAYRDRTIVTAETHLHALGLYVPLIVLAARASGDASYLAELRRFDRQIDRATTAPELANFNITSLMGEGYRLAIEAGLEDRRLPLTIRHLWTMGDARVDSMGRATLMSKAEARLEARPGLPVLSEPGVQDWEATRLAAIATLVPETDPPDRTGRLDLARKILLANRDPAIMTHADVPKCIAEVAITSWLLAYWLLREAGAAGE